MKSTANYKAYVLVIVTVPFLGAVLAIWTLWQQAVHPADLVLLITMYALTAVGVGVGFHRMLTHRSFRPHPFVKFVLLVLGSMGVEAPPIEWAATHIKHHAQSDREGDPHSPTEGLFHGLHWWQIDLSGYVIWALERLGLAHDVYRVSTTMMARYSSHDAGPVLAVPDVEAEAN